MMESLHCLVHSLSKYEIKNVFKYLSCLAGRKEVQEKTILFLKIILKHKNKIPTAEFCSKKIYGTYNADTFKKLKKLLRDKIYDCLLIDANLNQAEDLDETDDAVIRIKKKSALYTQLRYSKPSSPLLSKLLDEIIEKSKEYEYYPGLVEHLRYKKWKQARILNEQEFNKLNNDIIHFESCLSALNRATDAYHKVGMMKNQTSNINKQIFNSFLEIAIAETSVDVEITKSATVSYYLQWLQFAQHNLNENYLLAKQTCEKLTHFLKQHKAVFRNERISFVSADMARCEIYLRNYSHASTLASLSFNHLKKNSINLSRAKELEFLSHFYNNNFPEAEKCIELLLNNAKHDLADFDFSKYNFYNASLLFAQSKFKQAHTWLNKPYEIFDDKTGWAIGIRVLSILTSIELGDDKFARSLMENLQRFLERQKKLNKIVRNRDCQILSVLQSLEKVGFNFSELSEKGMQKLKPLFDLSGDYSWQPFTAELIPFHQWLNSKIKRKVIG